MNDFDRQRARKRASANALALRPSFETAPTSPPSSPSDAAGALRLPAALRADCARCVGLCCVIPAFYAVQGFGFDKPAHTACRHLQHDHRCGIHADLDARGFSGCRAFDCHGAGQRATQALPRASNWRTSPDAAARVFAAYERLLVLHRLMAWLALAQAALPPPFSARMRERRARLDALCGSISRAERLDTARVARVARGTMAMIRRNYRLAGATPGDTLRTTRAR